MFWRKKRKKYPIEGCVTQHDIQIVPPSNRLNSLNLRRNILDWKDKHTSKIEMQLRSELPILMNAIDVELNKLSIIQSTIKIKRITDQIIQPLFQKWVSTQSDNLLEKARSELLSIHHLNLGQLNSGEKINIQNSNAHVLDAITATSASACGVAVIPIFTSASIVSTGGLMGLFGATVISLPVLGTGLLISSIALTIGGIRMSGVKKRAIKRYRSRLQAFISGAVLGDKEKRNSCLNDQLQNIIFTACNDILCEIKE